MEPTQTPSYRYPGTKPFEIEDYRLFKGRDEDIQSLMQKILLQNLIVLYSRSGLGKSSLLNAGLLNKLKDGDSIVPIVLRFGAFLPGSIDMPLQKLQSIITEQFHANGSSFLYNKLIKNTPLTSHHLWYLFKDIQIDCPSNNTFVLIFDQFEELFSYPEEGMRIFAKELSELFFVSVPQQLRNIITAKLQSDENDLSDNELERLYNPVSIKILFAIRSDKLSLLHNLTTFFPAVLQNCYELKPLNRKQAREAIVAPAKLNDGSFLSPPFSFSEDAISLILDELTNSTKTDIGQDKQDIETFQLQIVCKHAENVVIEKKIQQIEAADLGNIKDIFENLYRNIINSLAPESRLPARKLLEEKLIIDGVRVSMPLAFILKEEGMTHSLVDELIATHILRPELNDTVEISHDTLVEPILRFYDERKKEEFLQNELKDKEKEIQRIKLEQDKQQKEQLELRERQLLLEKNQRTQKRFILWLSLVLVGMIGLAIWAFDLQHNANLEKQKADNLVHLFYFYDGKLALAYNSDSSKYGFINKDGIVVTGLKYDYAAQFNPKSGFAIGQISGDAGMESYLIDTSGKDYMVTFVPTDTDSDITAWYLPDQKLVTFPLQILKNTKSKIIILNNNPLNVLPDSIRQLKDLQILNLNNTGLAVLSPAIWGLAMLRILNLGSNKIHSIDNKIGHLTNLQDLDISDNKLSNLPDSLWKLKNVVSLDLSKNQLNNLSVGIGHLTNLNILNASHNRLNGLPTEIGKLINLRILQLNVNQISSLPNAIEKLTKLTNLNLDNNKLKALPVEIGLLKNLKSLRVGINPLEYVPASIGQLSKLEELNLGTDSLNTFPPEIGQLKNLLIIYLDHNKLGLTDSLPDEIGQLSKLNELDLANNYLKALPVSIGQLKNLRDLNLSNNQLTDLPAEIGQLKNLHNLILAGNPIPRTVLARITKLLPNCRITF